MGTVYSIINVVFPQYGLFIIVGVVLSATISVFLKKRKCIDWFDFLCASVFILIGALVGSKILYVIVSIEIIVELKLSFEEIMRGGFVFYGGLLGGALGLWLFCKQFKLNFYDYADVCAVVVPLGHAFGRVGCFFSGCCYGIEYDGFLSYTYDNSINYLTPIGRPLLPIQLIEATLLLILFLGGLVLFLRKSETSIPTILYLTSYSIIRFILEFFRGDVERGVAVGLSTSQWISILIFAFSVIKIVLLMLKKKAPA